MGVRSISPLAEHRPKGKRIQGIVVADGRSPRGPAAGDEPRIVAFVWGGKVRPSPTLPYGRWKGAA